MTLSTANSTIQSLQNLLDARQIVAVEQLPTTAPYHAVYGSDESFPPLVYPQSIDELRSLMVWATQDQKTVLVCGNASKLAWGNPIERTDVIISTHKLNQIIDYAVDDLTITVQAGISFQDLQSRLRAKDQILPVDPTHPELATIGGILSTRDSGSLRQRYGGVREMCLGLSFVRADGAWAKAGGRVVKNVAGYDLMKLLTGACGSLGIISEVTLRLYPMQESSHTVLFSGATDLVASLSAQILDSTLTPVAIDLLSQSLLGSLEADGEMGLAVRFQSLTESVVAQVNRLKQMGATLAVIDYQDDADEQLWQGLRRSLWEGVEGGPSALISKVGMLPHSIPGTLQTFQAWCDSRSVQLQAQVLAGWGIGHLKLTGDHDDLKSLVGQMRRHCEAHQGYLSLLEAPITIKQAVEAWGYPGNAIAPMQKLKAKFDPHGLLNPGRFVGGL